MLSDFTLVELYMVLNAGIAYGASMRKPIIRKKHITHPWQTSAHAHARIYDTHAHVHARTNIPHARLAARAHAHNTDECTGGRTVGRTHERKRARTSERKFRVLPRFM